MRHHSFRASSVILRKMDFLDDNDGQVDDFSYLDYGSNANNSNNNNNTASKEKERQAAAAANTQSSEYRFSDFTATSQDPQAANGSAKSSSKNHALKNGGSNSQLDDLSLASLSLNSQLSSGSSADVSSTNNRPIAFEDLEDEEQAGIDEDEIIPEHACKCVPFLFWLKAMINDH